MATHPDSRWIGDQLAEPLPDVPWTMTVDRQGIAKATVIYSIQWDAAMALIAKLRTHPDYSFMSMEEGRAVRGEGGSAVVTVDYAGIADSTYEFDDTEDRASYSAEGTASEEPIETNKRFKDFAGTMNDPKNGARFATTGDERGQFLGFFDYDDVDDHPKAGVKSFLSGGIVFNESRVYDQSSPTEQARADMKALGCINQPPKVDSYVDVDPKRDWLLIGCGIAQIGKGVKVTRSWRLSGPNGWDTDIYEKK